MSHQNERPFFHDVQRDDRQNKDICLGEVDAVLDLA